MMRYESSFGNFFQRQCKKADAKENGPKLNLGARFVQNFIVQALPESSEVYCFVQEFIAKEQPRDFKRN
jgi:hypothetical protein